MDGKIEIKIDYQKFEQDALRDGLKGYVTNANLPDERMHDKLHKFPKILPLQSINL